MNASAPALGYKIAVLVFVENSRGEHLLLLRNKAPNRGSWSPLGGKLETAIGESPFECAAREAHEEAGIPLNTSDLHLFAMIAERAYEGQSHWLLFLFRSRRRHDAVPPDIAEGRFAFFSREAIDGLPIPETDRTILWPLFDRHRDGFVALRADCDPAGPIVCTIEETLFPDPSLPTPPGTPASAAPPSARAAPTSAPRTASASGEPFLRPTAAAISAGLAPPAAPFSGCPPVPLPPSPPDRSAPGCASPTNS